MKFKYLVLFLFSVFYFTNSSYACSSSAAVNSKTDSQFYLDKINSNSNCHSSFKNICINRCNTQKTLNENSYLSLITTLMGIQLLIAQYCQEWNIDKVLKGHILNINSIALSCKGNYLVSGSDDETIKVWDIASGECLKTLIGHREPVCFVIISPNSNFIASGSYDNSIKIWDLHTGNCIRTIYNTARSINSVAYSPDSNYIAYGNWAGVIKLLNTITGKCSNTFPGNGFSIKLIIYSPNGEQIAYSGPQNNNILIVEPETGNKIHTLKGHVSYVKSIEYSSDSKFLASTSDDSIRIWHTQTGKCIKVLNGYNSNISATVYSPKGKHLVSGFNDKSVKIFNTITGDCIDTLSNNNSIDIIAYSPCGRYIACVSGKNIDLWENFLFRLLD